MLTDSLKRSIVSAARLEHEARAKSDTLKDGEIDDDELALLNGGGHVPQVPPEGTPEINFN